MSGLSFIANRLTRSWRQEAANWVSDLVSDVCDLDPQEARKWVGGGVMLATGIGTSIVLADVAGLFDPGNIADVVTAFDAGDAGSAATSFTEATSGAIDVPSPASHDLHFGNQYVQPGDPIYGTTPDGDPVGWSNGHYIDDRTWGTVTPQP